MRVPELGRDPDHGARIETGEVGEDLAEMPVVAYLKLILDKHGSAVRHRAGKDIGGEPRHRDLRLDMLQLQPDRLAEPVEIGGEPRREAQRLMRPGQAHTDILQVPQRDRAGHAKAPCAADASTSSYIN